MEPKRDILGRGNEKLPANTSLNLLNPVTDEEIQGSSRVRP